MITKLTSSKSVIAKVIADLNLSEDDIRVSDFLEWIGEAVEKIGAVTQLIKKVSGVDGAPVIEINHHQAALPCDLHHLHQVAYSFNCNGPWFPMRKATGSFSVWGKHNCGNCCNGKCTGDCEGHCGHCCDHHGYDCGCCPDTIIQDDVMANLVVDMYGNIDKTEALEMINSNQNMRTILSNLINCHTVDLTSFHGVDSANPSMDLQYSIKPGYIMTNVPCGYLKLSYSAIPIDEEGYPLVPDKASFMEAIYWYITMKMKYKDYLNGTLRRDVYYDIRNSWNFYCKQAYAEALMPNEDGMESLKNNWNKLVPEFNDHSTFYSHTGERQIIYNAN